ncbi:hypothetical protein Moror_14258 [Moniliophthora roreri MCA 2997]|uniref:Uncharacterized protein n=2 Tax=Moniliophthora roreri TaxID=221103 RepID=V2YSS1_MONRO|nr:hypothetical protein Moror_14258 [Moniliophthora roreri MCA 2997]
MNFGSPIIIDDRDPSIEYYPPWRWWTSGFVHGTVTANASLNLTFHGITIGVYGTIVQAPTERDKVPTSRYSIDGEPATVFTAPRLQAKAHQQLFYQSPVLEDRKHTLMISMDTQGPTYYLDYFNVTPGIQATSSLSSSLSTISVLPSTSTSTSLQDASGTTTPSSVSTSIDAKLTKTHLIGGVVGGVTGALLLLALISIVLVRRRKQKGYPLVVPFYSQPEVFQSAARGRRVHTKTQGGSLGTTSREGREIAMGPPSYHS